jgi:hypothetical protein
MKGRRQKIDARRIRVSQSYAIPEIARLLGRTIPTVRSWIKQGLPVLPDTSPRLICGEDLKNWLSERARNRKQPCGLARLYCCKCRRPQRPKPDTVGTSELTSKNVKVSGKCGACGTQMQQSRKLADLPVIIAAMKDPTQGQASLTGYSNALVNPLFEQASDQTDLDASQKGKFHVH